MVRARLHGGECCGIVHLHQFGAAPTPERLRELDSAISARTSQRNFRATLFEVVLTSRQAIEWDNTLLKRGFRRVNSFCNSNSGNYCHVYHMRTKQFLSFLGVSTEEGDACAVGFFFWRQIVSFIYLVLAVGSFAAIYGGVQATEYLVRYFQVC